MQVRKKDWEVRRNVCTQEKKYYKYDNELMINTEVRKYGRVNVPPLSAYGVLVVPPAEYALIGTGQGRGRLHALVADDGVL